jgi:hypothetical protein
MKLAIAIVLGFSVYIAMGYLLPVSQTTAIVVTLLGSFGAFSYKAIAGLFTFCALLRA